MSCSQCGDNFSVFKREHGCSVCGFSVCSRCVKKWKPENSKKTSQVCGKCLLKVTVKEEHDKTQKFSPPAALERRMGELGNLANKYSSNQEQELAERLAKLKGVSNENVGPSQEELEERLAKLKGMSSVNTPSSKVLYQAPDRRSEEEKTRDLMEKMTDEISLDARVPDPDKEIACRLARLKGMEVPSQATKKETPVDPKQFVASKQPNKDESFDAMYKSLLKESTEAAVAADAELKQLGKNKDLQKKLQEIKGSRNKNTENSENKDEESDDDDEINALVERAYAEKDLFDDDQSINSSDFKEKELPWCVICNEDAWMRCYGCDGDLYCRSCFKQFHSESDTKDHPTKRYEGPEARDVT